MSSNKPDNELDDESWTSRRWTESDSGLFESVFPLSEEEVYTQLHIKGLYNPKYYSYDHLRLQALQDFQRYKFTINSNKQSIDKLVRAQILKELRIFFKKSSVTFPLTTQLCPYCKTVLLIANHQDIDEEYASLTTGALEYCQNCHYWRWSHLEGRDISRYSVEAYQYTSYLSKMREFNDTLPDGCASDIALWIRRDQARWHSISPSQLEKLVADIFRANYAYTEVTHVGKPDDGGVDVLFIDAEGKQWLIQVKRREKPSYSEPVGTIRNLLGTMILEESLQGIVVSTADHFTYRAYQAVNRVKKRGMIVKLVDRGILNKMMGSMLPDRPWLLPLKANYPDFAERFSEIIPSVRYQQLKWIDASDS